MSSSPMTPPTTPPAIAPTLLLLFFELPGWSVPEPELPSVEPDVSASALPSPPDADPAPLEDVPVPIPPVMLATRAGVE